MTALFLVAALVLVAFGGLLAACDAALIGLSRAEVQETALVSRHRRALLAIAADPGAHLNAVNFVRVLAETTAAVLVTLAVTTFLEHPWLVLLVAAVIMTAVSFVLVGASPRSVGRAHPREVLRFAAPVVRAARLVLGPLATLLAWLGNTVTPGRSRSTSFTSEEQLLSMVDEATEAEVLERDDRELIHSVFQWGETVVREVMVPRTDMVSVESALPLDAAMRLLLNRALSRVPVRRAGDADDIVGVLHLRDVARVLTEQPGRAARASDLVRPVLFVPDSKKADETLRQMQTASNHLAMVVDEYGGIAGLVTLEDLIEELVGEITDESDRESPEVVREGDGRWLVPARLPLDELSDLVGHEVDDEDVESVGGLLTKHLDRLPMLGDAVRTDGLVLTAERIEGRRRGLARVRVERLPEDAPEDAAASARVVGA